MIVLRDETRIRRYRSLSQVLSLVGLAALIGGFIVGLQGNLGLQLLGLLVGFLLSQVGLQLAHRYLDTPQRPRPDKILDEALRKVARDSRMYHYLLPASHVLLTPAGPIIFVTQYQRGDISVTKDKKGRDKWHQKGLGLRRFFGQERLGNPTRDAEIQVGAMANYLRKHAPEVEEVPLGVIIVFTTQRGGELDVKNATVPAMHVSKLRGYFKQNAKGEPLPAADYEALRRAFDKKAANLEEQTA